MTFFAIEEAHGEKPDRLKEEKLERKRM